MARGLGRLLGRTVAAMAAAAVVLVAAPAPATAPSAGVSSTGVSEAVDYVALGDSYSAGPLIPEITGGGCIRSTNNYPAQLAPLLGVATYTDVTCSGARHRDLREEQSVLGGGAVPPQYDALDAGTDLVTLGMGGNDYGLFGSIVSTCPQVRERDPDGSPCREEFTRRIDGRLVDTKARDARRIEDHVARAVRGVLRRSPDATVLVVGYPRLLPTTGTCDQVPFATGDYDWARHVAWLLNRSLRRGAEAEGAAYVNLWPSSLGHDACAGAEAWVNGHQTRLDAAAAYHPFEAGMTNAAALVAERLAAAP